MTNELIRYDSMLRLDLKDLYIHTRMFLDLLCKVIKLSYGKRGNQLPSRSMNELLAKRDKAVQLDPEFLDLSLG
jgi:hypothetical protein